MSNPPYGNETIRVLHQRASARDYEDRGIPDEVMEQILLAGVRSASGGNLQPYSIVKITRKETLEALVSIGHQSFIREAPVALLFCIDWHRTRRWCEIEKAPFTAHHAFRHFWISFQDTLIAAQSICVAADSFGLGSVYVGTVLDTLPECRKLFHLPECVLPVVLVCMGYPKKPPRPAGKLPLKLMVHNEWYEDLPDEELAEGFNEKYVGKNLSVTPDDARVERIREVCLAVSGEALAEECVSIITERGFMSPAQHRFGLHYRADMVPLGNSTLMRAIEAYGFSWFSDSAAPGRERL